MRNALVLLAPLALVGTLASAAPPTPRGVSYARLGETVVVHGVRVTPLTVVEDSRCPARVACVWAGRVRITARVENRLHALTLGQPLPVPGGSLRLLSVEPARQPRAMIPPRAYRFGFRLERGDARGGLFELTRD